MIVLFFLGSLRGAKPLLVNLNSLSLEGEG